MQLQTRRAVSPIIATLLLIAIAVASGVVVYVFTNGLASNLTKSHISQVTEQLSMDAYSFTSPSITGVTIYLRNTGTGSVTPNAVYFDGASITPSGGNCLSGAVAVSGTCTVTLTGGSVASATAQTSHTIKVITSDGGIFSFNVVAGQTG